MTDFNAVAAKGAAFLDNKHPGWEDFINLDRLSMSHGENCILGQIYGNYTSGRQVLEISVDEGRAYGFDYGGRPGEGFRALGNAWWRIITERRNGVPSAKDNSVVVTKAQIDAAKAHIDHVAQHSPSFVDDLTSSGVLLHVLMDLGIKVKVTD